MDQGEKWNIKNIYIATTVHLRGYLKKDRLGTPDTGPDVSVLCRIVF